MVVKNCEVHSITLVENFNKEKIKSF